MAKKRVRGGKFLRKKRRGGGGRRRGWGFVPRRGGRSEGTSDEDYVVGEEEEEEEVDDDDDGSSYCSYSSDASREESSQDADSNSYTEEEEGEGEEEYEVSENEELVAARGRRQRKRPAVARKKPKATPPGRRRSAASRVVEDVEAEMETRIVRKPRSRPRRRSRISVEDEEAEYEDADDEDFAPDDADDDGEQLKISRFRKTGGKRNGQLKRQRGRSRPRKSKKDEGKKAASAKKKRRRTAPSSDDDDFVVDVAVLMEGTTRKTKRSACRRKRPAKRRRTSTISDDEDFVVEDKVLAERTNAKKRNKKQQQKKKSSASKGKKRRSRAMRSDAPYSDSSDFDYTISEEELRDLQVGRPLGRREQRTLSPAAPCEGKGRGKEVDDGVGKQTCGICLSEEQKGAIRGVLDCCTHYFCFACIMEWSKVESRCPLCKQRFNSVSQSTRSGAGLSLRAVVKRIPKRDQVYQPSEEEMRNYRDPYANVVCMECQQGGDDHLMLLCDICDSPAHTYCVGLGREVPEGNWYCDGCRSMDPGSSNSHVQESVGEEQTRNSDLLQDTSGEVESENATNCMPHETHRMSATILSPCQSRPGVGQGASSRYHSSLGDHGSAASGFAASTLSGRRSIHQRIRVMLSNNRIRGMPDTFASNIVTQPSGVESDFCSSEVDQPGEAPHVRQESLVNEINERNNRFFLMPRANMHPCTHNEASGPSIVEGAKGRVQSMVKNHLKCLTRDNPLGRRDFKDIARRATHTILAACGAQHRRSIVTLPVEPLPSCAHQADGELSGLVKECCSLCFGSFVGTVVGRLV